MLPAVFDYSGQKFRTVIKDGYPWFVGKDVCEYFGDTNYRRTISRLDDDEKGVSQIDTPGGPQQMSIINESGLYSLLFMMQPQKGNLPEEQYKLRIEQIRQFKRWITHEVIPSIRKTGGYVANDDQFIETYLPFADEQTKLLFRSTLGTIRKQNEQIAIMKPAKEYFDALVDRNLLTNFRDTAKELKVKEQFFINWLLNKNYVYRDKKGKLKPYAEHVPSLFELKESVKDKWAGTQTLITPRGRETFKLLIGKRSAV